MIVQYYEVTPGIINNEEINENQISLAKVQNERYQWNQLRKEGKKLEVAIIEAATIRLRPILMTSLSTLFGVLPLIISFGPGAASRLTVGITIFGGMLFSTFFTLYVIPTVYTIIGKNTQRIDAVEIELNKQLKK